MGAGGLHLQPRPRGAAGHADRAHRARGRAGDGEVCPDRGVKLAVVLFNLGGPDGPAAVRPFLANLFRDPAIISLPAVARIPLAAMIAKRREKAAQANYDLMGGAS